MYAVTITRSTAEILGSESSDRVSHGLDAHGHDLP
jgi:hypothetical protein